MAISKVHLVLVFLLAVPPVMARRGTWVDRVTSAHVEDPCDAHEVACNPTAMGTRAVILVSSFISIVVMAPGCMRVLKLKKTSRSEDDTLFWWYLLLGSGGFMAWVFYFWKCQFDSSLTAFPIFMASLLLSVMHICLLIWATIATSGTRDRRLVLMIAGPVLIWIADWLLWYFAPLDYVGWWGFSVISLAHAFRVASINYRDSPAGEIKLFCASLTHKQFFGCVSVVGAVSGLLWLIHPQLCFSLQYKVTSYAIALVRVWETCLCLSNVVARGLSTIEGQTEE